MASQARVKRYRVKGDTVTITVRVIGADGLRADLRSDDGAKMVDVDFPLPKATGKDQRYAIRALYPEACEKALGGGKRRKPKPKTTEAPPPSE